ncbi:uncharacterized protein LOC124898596 [Capsicum annuum]|uniref:uncharacterized protein LOC124898596 n=1 Tax=Capsicum annuum TaxID=4072 RepID=UPI001FB1979F|nr:uncharacterized protein LOC124898596 [Capsicum annuum]
MKEDKIQEDVISVSCSTALSNTPPYFPYKYVSSIAITFVMWAYPRMQASNAKKSASVTSEANRVGQFMRINPPKYSGPKVEEDLQEFVDEMEKIFRVIHVDQVEGVELAVYQLKDVANQWYNEWEDAKGESVDPTIWTEFMEAFLDRFFPLKLKEAKAKEFMNLK